MSFTYGINGEVASFTDPNNQTVYYTYDAIGRVTGISRPDGGNVALGYDNNGNLTSLTTPSGITHAFTYNGVNQNASYQTPLSGSYAYTYDRDKNLSKIVMPSGREINYSYTLGQLTGITTPEGNIALNQSDCGKLDSIANADATIAYTYDGSLVTAEDYSGTLSGSVYYTYDNDFALTSLSYAGGTENFTYDNDGLLISAGEFNIDRNPDNGLPESFSDGVFMEDVFYNGYGEEEAAAAYFNSITFFSYNLTRGIDGLIQTKTENIAGTESNYAYLYDAMGRLLSVTKDGVLVEEYQYDTQGRRTYEMNALRGIAGRSFSYSDEDHLLTAGDATYEYDLDGYLTSKTIGADITLYNYSSRGELLWVELPDGTRIDYVYDPLGRRIAKKVDGIVIEKYLWQGMTKLLAVYDDNDTLLMRFNYADGRMPVSMEYSGATYYLLYDQIGTLKAVADSTGNIVKQVDYDSFGSVLSDSNPTLSVPFGFAGGLHDRDSGLVHFGYRDYDPEVGRWTAKDPIGFSGGDTDLYGYCVSDPVNWIDNNGFEYKFVVNAGAHIAFGSIPVAYGLNIGAEYSFKGEVNAPDPSFEMVVGSRGDIGVSAGFSDFACGEASGPTISVGHGKYGGAQVTLRGEPDSNREWYNPMKYVGGVSVGVGTAVPGSSLVNVTIPLYQ